MQLAIQPGRPLVLGRHAKHLLIAALWWWCCLCVLTAMYCRLTGDTLLFCSTACCMCGIRMTTSGPVPVCAWCGGFHSLYYDCCISVSVCFSTSLQGRGTAFVVQVLLLCLLCVPRGFHSPVWLRCVGLVCQPLDNLLGQWRVSTS